MKSLSRVTIASILIGTILEWYDFSLIGSLAPVISVLFFPSLSPTLSLLATFGVFATGFIARPIGGLIFGHIGDIKGRRHALSMTIILMGIPTTCIGLLPNYQQIGMLAPSLLILLRLIQGIASSGEYPGAICLLMELAPENKRGFFSSLSMLGVVGGVFLGSLVNAVLTSTLSDSQIHYWGWRIPFMIGIPLSCIGYYLRHFAQESGMFCPIKTRHTIPIKKLLQTNSKGLLKIVLFFSLSTVSFYLGFVYINGYLVSTGIITLHQSMINNAIGTALLACMIPVFGYLSDHISRKKLLLAGNICLLVFYYPIFKLFLTGGSFAPLFSQISLAFIIALFAGPLASIAAETFPTETRYTGTSIGINLGATIFGGTCPIVASYLVNYTGQNVSPIIMVISLSLILMLYIRT